MERILTGAIRWILNTTFIVPVAIMLTVANSCIRDGVCKRSLLPEIQVWHNKPIFVPFLFGYGEGKSGFVDSQGRLAIPLKFDEAMPFAEGLAPARIGDKWGYIDTTGTFVIKPQFHAVLPFSEGLAAVPAGKKWGYI